MEPQLPQNPGAAPAAAAPLRVILEQPRPSWLARGLKWAASLLLVLLAIGLFYNEDQSLKERWHSRSKTSSDKIAVITVRGTILGEEGFAKDQIDHVRDDDSVKAVVLRVDSPGGTVTGSDFLYHRLKKLTKEKQIPLVVSMGSLAASGGYYIAMAAGDTENTIFAEPTTWTGSIGVIIPHYNVSKLLERWDIQDDSIASHPLKMMGSPTRIFPEPIAAEQKQILEGLVASSFEGFKEIVLASRPKIRGNEELQKVVFSGRIFTARQAQENLLVDKLGFIEDAIDRAAELAKLEKDSVRVVKYEQPVGALSQMLFGPQSRARSLDLAAIADAAVPRAYYLFTWMPALAPLAQ